MTFRWVNFLVGGPFILVTLFFAYRLQVLERYMNGEGGRKQAEVARAAAEERRIATENAYAVAENARAAAEEARTQAEDRIRELEERLARGPKAIFGW